MKKIILNIAALAACIIDVCFLVMTPFWIEIRHTT